MEVVQRLVFLSFKLLNLPWVYIPLVLIIRTVIHVLPQSISFINSGFWCKVRMLMEV
jgi:hypothetical protein